MFVFVYNAGPPTYLLVSCLFAYEDFSSKHSVVFVIVYNAGSVMYLLVRGWCFFFKLAETLGRNIVLCFYLFIMLDQ